MGAPALELSGILLRSSLGQCLEAPLHRQGDRHLLVFGFPFWSFLDQRPLRPDSAASYPPRAQLIHKGDHRDWGQGPPLGWKTFTGLVWGSSDRSG